MNNNFPKLAMAKFSESFKGRNLLSMHATNPEPFSQSELEQTIGQSFHSIIKDVNLGFSADEGTIVLRQTLAKKLYENIAANDVITHAGAQEALFCAFSALLQAGDKVLVVAPIFEPLVRIPLNMGCEISYLHLDNHNGWSLNIDAIEQQFKQECKIFVINFPHNPTGAQLTEQELLKIVSLCKKYDVWLLSDEVFRGLEHDLKFHLPAVADIYEKGISIGVISKAFAVPGIRVGWLVCRNKELRDKVIDIKGYLSICNSQIDEKLASVVFENADKLLERNLKIILKNKRIARKIKSISGIAVDVFMPNAGCCVFAVIESKGVDPNVLVREIANNTHYLLYPSSLFITDINALRIGFGGQVFQKFVEIISV